MPQARWLLALLVLGSCVPLVFEYILSRELALVAHAPPIVAAIHSTAAPTITATPTSTPTAAPSSSSTTTTSSEARECDWNPNTGIPFPPSSSNNKSPILLIAIPTVHRASNNYLSPTLQQIDKQIAGLDSTQVKIVIVHNLHPDTAQSAHRVFLEEKLQREHDDRFHFIETINTLPFTGKSTDREHPNVPGPRVRQQTRDIVNTLRVITQEYSPQYLLFQEDDFGWCDKALFAFMYMARRLDLQHGKDGWLLVRFSFGFNGVLMHGNDGDVEALAGYLERHQTRRPPDHLLVEWFAGETDESSKHKRGRVHAAYKYNLLDHLGTHSSLRAANQPHFLSCWERLTVPTVFEVEAFPSSCAVGSEDIWPCERNNHICKPWGGI